MTLISLLDICLLLRVNRLRVYSSDWWISNLTLVFPKDLDQILVFVLSLGTFLCQLSTLEEVHC